MQSNALTEKDIEDILSWDWWGARKTKILTEKDQDEIKFIDTALLNFEKELKKFNISISKNQFYSLEE